TAGQRFDRLATEYPDGPSHPKALFWKAEAALQGDDPKTAEAVLGSVLTGPKPPVAENWFPTARLRHLQCLVLLERWEDVLAESAALKTDLPHFAQLAEVEYARGRALQAKARFDEARTAYQAVIDGRPGEELAAKAQFM